MSVSQVDLFVDQNEERLVSEVIRNRWLSEGPQTRAFMAEIGKLLGSEHVFPAPNGTLGLFLALLALDLEPGSEIIIPSFTFYASAMSAVFAGLKPVFIDVDPKTFNATPEAFAAAITTKTRAIMPVHIYGQMGDMDGIMDVARKHNLRVVEDAAQAFGVSLGGRSAGVFGDIGVFSFYSDKAITTGEGACLVTGDKEIAGRIALLRNQGRPNSGTFVHPSHGMNFRITDMQAAVGRAQLAKLPTIIEERLDKWKRYQAGLRGIGDLEFMAPCEGSTLVPFRFPILTDRRAALAAFLEEKGIQTRGFFFPLHLQPKLVSTPPQSLPCSEELNRRGMCLPVHHHLSEGDLEHIIDTIRRFFDA